MLGVFRRHWKPKRTSNSRKTKEKTKESSDDKSVEVLGAIVVTGHLLKDPEGDNGKQSEVDGETEKSDPVKEPVERQTVDVAQEKVQKDGLKEQIEREKMLRTEAEAQLREVHLESERCKTRLISLQEDFSKMEEMVCNMLQFKSRIEQLKHEKSSITLAYESKIRKYQSCIASLEKENFMLLNQIRSLQLQKNKDYQDEWEHSLSWLLLERLRLLEQENSSLVLESEQQQLQYEHCLDDVANQVVQALLAQKGLREECAKLQRRVQDLERQNHTLGIIFKQCLFHNDNSDQPGKELLNNWPKSPEVHEDTWFENTQQFKHSQLQQLHHDSPSHNSQSEDSTESLASMCSDYSAHSGSSGGNPLSHPGLPKMTSPPQWMKEGLCDRRASRISPVSFIQNPCFSSRSGQLKSSYETMSKYFEPNRQGGCECRHSVVDNSLFRAKHLTSQTLSHAQKSDIQGDRCDWDKRRESFSRTHILSNDTGSLDSMETPNDDCLNADSLSLLSSSQRLLVSSQYKPIHNAWTTRSEQLKSRQQKQKIKTGYNNGVSVASCCNRTVNNSAGQNCVHRPISSIPIPTVIAPIHSVSRPTTLNIIPHIMGDPTRNFGFPALEHKGHIINECGNVYEDLDAPMFPGSVLNCNTSCSTASEPFEEENIFASHLGSSSEEGEAAMNTVIRKTHAGNSTSETDCQSTNTQLTGQQPKIPARELPPTPVSDSFNFDKTPYKNQEWKNANQTIVLRSCVDSKLQDPATNHITPLTNMTIQENSSPLSVVTEHGNKDEGYSTMSSDVQGELNTDSVSHMKQPCSSPLPLHSSGYISVKSLPDLAEEDRGEILCSKEDIVEACNYVQNFQPIFGEVSEEVCSGFERDLDSSLIRNKCDKTTESTCHEDDNIKAANETVKDNLYLNTSDSIISDIECNVSSDTNKSHLAHSARSRILPTYDKLLTLLTPQGFKSHRSDPRRVTLPFIQYSESSNDGTYPPKRVQTAEKATITEPDSSNQLLVAELLNKSDLSISSNESNDKVNTIKPVFECKDNVINLNFGEKYISKSTDSDHCAVHKDLNNRPKSSIDTYGRECYNSGRTYSKHHELCLHSYHHCSCYCERKCLVQDDADAMCCKCGITRTLSDSHLFIRDFCMHPFELTKAASINNKYPATRLNMVPLECHTSACDLSNSLQLTPPLRRSQRQVLIADDMSSTEKQDQVLNCEKRIWKRNSQCSPSLSLSSVHSSTSVETGCAEEDEELVATSLKCSMHPDLTSESEDESGILENHNFVEEWLQREEPQPAFRHQNCYTYDEEEIGNWSLQPSNEDVRNMTTSNEIWEGHWNNQQEQLYSDKIYVHQLERIQETSLEDNCQPDYWNTQWNSSNIHKTEQTNTQQQNTVVDNETSENINYKIIINEEVECNITNNSFPLQTEEIKTEDNHHSLKECTYQTAPSSDPPSLDFSKDDSCNGSVMEEKNEFNGLQCDATEFNRDFYRLCTVGSTRSLVISECGSHNETDHVPETTIENQPVVTECHLPFKDREEILNVPIEEISTELSEKPVNTLAEEILVVPLRRNENIAENHISIEGMKSQENSDILSQVVDESNIVELGKENVTTAVVPKKNKIKTARSTDVKNGLYSTGKHPYSRVMIDKLYVRERTKITTSSKKTTPERKKKHTSKSGSSKTKTENSDDQSRKLMKDDLNQSSMKKVTTGKKITRQITRESCREITGCINTTIASISENESKKPSSKKERRDIKMKNHVLKNVSQTKSKSVKLNEISGLSEKDGIDLEKKLAGEEGHMSVADKIQELNALLLKDEKGQSILPVQKMKIKKIQNTESKNSSLEMTKHIQLKEQVTFKKTSIKEGCGTSWVHVEADIDLSDPKARANLLDSMMASSSSSGTEDEGEDEVLEHKQHERLHALHRFRRHRKRATGKDAAISFIPRVRASIIDRHDFYFRYGEKEMEAVSCFDFLDDMSTSPSDGGSCELLGRESVENNNNVNNHTTSVYTDNPSNTNRLSLDDSKLSSNKRHFSENRLSSTTLNSQDGEVVDHISLSDSCAESYSSSTHSLNQIV